MTRIANRKLFDACDPFARVANIVDALPSVPGDTPIRDVLPGAWPTVHDLRKLRDEMRALGWTNEHSRADR